ncbi:hypothetical protein [Methanobrevibacter sp.]|uniref:hypothetical protein n=1 Tax=Methanobrevibacter sp. TaxID=66852 RepID=UPI00386FB070
MLQDEYNAIGTKIHNLKDQRSDFEEKLKHTSDEDDEIEYKFQIMKINEKLGPLEEKHKILSEKLNKEHKIKEQQEKEKSRKEKLYKKLYVTLDDKKLNEIKKELNIYQSSKDGIIKELINQFSTEQEILNAITPPKVPKAKLQKTVRYIESNYNMKFKEVDKNTLYFKKKLYSTPFKNMDESDYKDYDLEEEKILDELYHDSQISDDFEFSIDFSDYLEYYDFVKKIQEDKEFFNRQTDYISRKNNESTYKKNVARYDELIAEKRRMKNKK